jgi:TPR repeat protein
MNITMTMGARGDADYQQLEKAGQAFDNGDYQAAYRIFKPLAEKGHMGAAYMMGLNYKFGNVDPVDSAKAVEWFEKGLRVSHPGSMYHLSWNMRNGSGTQKDFQGGVELLKQAAHRGHLTAINDFGGDILNGNYKASTAEGIAYIMIAADHGERTAVDNLEKLKRNNDQQTISQARKIADEQLLPEIQNSAGSGDFILGYHSYVVVTPK